MFLISLRSGSYGNGYIISDGSDSLLFDAGVPRKLVLWAMREFDIPQPENIFISHEHSDHTKTLDVLVRAFSPTIYATEGTFGAMFVGTNGADRKIVDTESEIPIGNFAIRFISKPHDAAEPVSFIVERTSGEKIAIITDIGYPEPAVVDAAKNVNTLLIESNYEPEMLRNSDYPEELKERIAGDYGHLSNFQCVEFLQQVSFDKLSTVILGHLSEHNNLPQLALDKVKPKIPSDVKLVIASRYEPVAVKVK
ncbi:MBL fold metallo-hydrolase, partial [bacterium]|nr:MBL fold metallo-hydrolase [bacterium]